MRFLENIYKLYRKDVLLEARTGITLLSVLLLSFLLLLIFNFGFKITDGNAQGFAPGILWITFSFTGVLALQRLFEHERERGALSALMMSPAGGLVIYFSKFLLHFSIMVLIELSTIAVFAVFFHPQWGAGVIFKIVLISVSAAAGFSGVGVLLSSMLYKERLKDLLMPLIFYPLVIPLVITAVKCTETAIAGGNIWGLHLYIIGFDLIFISASVILYDYVLEGD